MRRFKYLEKMFEEEMKKVLVFIKGFKPSERIKLARMTALWLGKYSKQNKNGKKEGKRIYNKNIIFRKRHRTTECLVGTEQWAFD